MNFKSLLAGVVPAFVSVLVACGGGAEPAGQTGEALTLPGPGDSGTTTCSGVIDPICEVCADGKSACAHWEVLAGECKVVICPASETPSPPGAPTASSGGGTTSSSGSTTSSSGGTTSSSGGTGSSSGGTGSSGGTTTCTGILPPICEQCADGTTACNHWEVVNGVCEAKICD